MAITLILANNIQEGEENPWLKDGIQGPDKELAEECGLLTPREMSDFDKMIEEEEEFSARVDHEAGFECDPYDVESYYAEAMLAYYD